ncbi:MAG: Omp28-related outer membrane protein [Bacteroidales bacterium]|nr:Omp28-related outer membrane protein [Bacteroidales bacterium]MDD4683836.1 Omp28-related outer membrane protein [Bacteroidales bacterium]
MKKILYSLLLIIPLLWVSCDTIEDDAKLVMQKGETTDTTPITVRSSKQRVLLEDFTGWRCTNCPAAAEKATELISKYGDKLVVMGVHATSFAKPSAENNNVDFRTEFGDKWATDFGCTSLPAGMINRTKVGSGYKVETPDWDINIQNALATKEHIMDINLGAVHRQADNMILVSCENEFLKDYASPTLISILVLESGIIGVQKSNETPIIEDYVFNHVLRKNGLVDFSLSVKPVSKNEIIYKNYLVKVDSDIQDITKCSVVVFVTNAETKEIIQVNTIEL